MHHYVEKAEMIEIAKAHQADMEAEVRYGDKDHHIKIITFEYDSVYHNPMGGFFISGYVNNNKNLDFQIMFNKYNNKIKCSINELDPELIEWKGLDN